MPTAVPTIPTAASDSNPFSGMFPTIAVSVMERMGSAIPAIVAGTANLLMVLKLMAVLKYLAFKTPIHNNEMNGYFV